MEQEQLPCEKPGPGQCGCDREIFERVWRRVMPTDRPDCPFTLYADEMNSGLPVEAVKESVPPAPAPTPAEALPPAVLPGWPTQENNPCLGPASAVYGGLLQCFIEDELSDQRTYHAMAKRTGGSQGKILSGIAADELRHAKRLSAAYFLISGVRFWPEQPIPALTGAYPALLRIRFQAEQRGESSYRTAAAGCSDPCLCSLFLELAEEEGEHTRLIRTILERF